MREINGLSDYAHLEFEKSHTGLRPMDISTEASGTCSLDDVSGYVTILQNQKLATRPGDVANDN